MISMTERVERAIAKKPMTAKQLKARFPKIVNVYDVMHQLSNRGYEVKKDKDAKGFTLYSL
jgi:hypothetical protein